MMNNIIVSRRGVMAGIGAAALLPAGMLRAEGRVFKASIALEGNRVIVAVGINGTGPYIFMIDTGAAASLIRDDLAKEIALPITSHSRFGGVGGQDIYPVFTARDLVIGGTMRQADVAFVGAGNLDYGPDIRGALAAGIVTTRDSVLDFDRGEIRLYPDGLHDRDGFVDSGGRIEHSGGEAASAYLYATASVNGQPLRFLLDTGAPGAISLFPSGATKTGLSSDARPYAPSRPGGIGGMGPIGRIVRAERVAFGGLQLDRPLITIDGRASRTADIADGLIGLALLRRFNLATDARRRTFAIQRNQQPAPPERPYRLSGIWLDRKGDAVIVAAVGTGSPAAAAGVMAGDRLVGALPDLLRSINGPPGKAVTLPIDRNGTKRAVSFVLQPFL